MMKSSSSIPRVGTAHIQTARLIYYQFKRDRSTPRRHRRLCRRRPAAAAVVGRPKFGGTSFRALTFWKRCSPLASGCEPIFSNPALAPGHCSAPPCRRRRAAAMTHSDASKSVRTPPPVRHQLCAASFLYDSAQRGARLNLRHYGISLEVYEIYEFDSFFFVFQCMASVNRLFCNTDILESIGMIRMRKLGTM